MRIRWDEAKRQKIFMNKKRSNVEDIESIAKKAHRGEDVSEHFTGEHLAKQRVNIDLPLRFTQDDRRGMQACGYYAPSLDQNGLR